MTVGKLIKINEQKKLVMKIGKPTYDNLLKRMQAIADQFDYAKPRFAVWSFVDDCGEEQYRLNVKLDKYDIRNLEKFERLLREDVSFFGRLQSYDFFDQARGNVCGVNYTLTSIRKLVKARPVSHLEAALDEEAAKAEAFLGSLCDPTGRVLSTDTTLSPLENDVDEFVNKMAALAVAAK